MKEICQKVKSILNKIIVPFFIRLFKPESATKKHKDISVDEIPNISMLEEELEREKHKKMYGKTLKSTMYTLIVVSAVAVLIATIFFPVLKIYGASMAPTVKEGEIIIALKSKNFDNGDVVALWYGNKLLVKRIIATPGQWVNIDADGDVYIDGKKIEESYVSNKSLGDCNVELPLQVPEGKYFVLGDHRNISQDSRNSVVGCITKEDIVGRLILRVWPFNEIKKFD